MTWNMADDNMYTQRLKNASLLEMSDSAGLIYWHVKKKKDVCKTIGGGL